MIQLALYTRFAHGLSRHWHTLTAGAGRLTVDGDGLRLINHGASTVRYTNAQIDDYQGRARRDFLWRPPLTLSARVRFSHPGAHESGVASATLGGTAGFGFWNDPFLMTGLRTPALPQAVWFFYAAPPSDMVLDMDTPGWGWKAATIDARRWTSAGLAPTLPLAMPLMNLRPLYRLLWPMGQRAMGVRERLVPVGMNDWHVYTLEWRIDSVHFRVDGGVLLETETAPQGPLGLVIWLDNQYLQATPWGRFRYGRVAKGEVQWMEIDWLAVEPRWTRRVADVVK